MNLFGCFLFNALLLVITKVWTIEKHQAVKELIQRFSIF